VNVSKLYKESVQLKSTRSVITSVTLQWPHKIWWYVWFTCHDWLKWQVLFYIVRKWGFTL